MTLVNVFISLSLVGAAPEADQADNDSTWPLVTRVVPLDAEHWGITLRHRPSHPLVETDKITTANDERGLVVSKMLGDHSSVQLVLLKRLEGDFTVRVSVGAPPRGGGTGGGGTAIPYYGFRSEDGEYEALDHASMSGNNDQSTVFEVSRTGDKFVLTRNGRLARDFFSSNTDSGYFTIHMNDRAMLWIEEIEVAVRERPIISQPQPAPRRCILGSLMQRWRSGR